ncbi:hypothetical protein ACF0H5_003903 [Mactra antiquata]
MKTIDKVKIGSPYGFVVLSMIFQSLVPLFVSLDKCKGYPTNLPECFGYDYDDGVKLTTSATRSSTRTKPQKLCTITDSTASLHTSMTSLSEVETYRKYAYATDETGTDLTNNCESVSTRASYIRDDLSMESRV